MLMKLRKLLHELKPILLMVVAQLSFSGVNVFYKLASYDGMNLRVLIAYRFIFASAFLIPLALIFERKIRPKLTKTILFQAFLCGFIGGSLTQTLYVEGLVLTSATFASAMTNLTPAVTFVLAILFGLEKMGLRTLAGKAKVMGTLLGIGGAMLLIFFKGAEIDIWSTHVNLMKLVKPHGGHVAASDSTRVLGSLLSICNCISFSVWLIIQAKMSANFPCPYSSAALMASVAAILQVVFTLCIDRDLSQWKLGWNIRLFTAAYAGIVVQGVTITLITWCVSIKGPLYASIFNPLQLVFSALEGSLLIDEPLHVGSILGATLIVCGLYTVLWGKDTEAKKISQLIPLKISEEIEIMSTTNSTNSNCQNCENCNRGKVDKNLSENIHEKEEKNTKEEA
ncbi:hypothetical protein JCGZ_06597 [Jatropha curcas]|uniref:WAT1-related protein n=1 Tax=Jatropha curcas TaxID=180498 RepID=A0A067LC71_JATCU|nr:hypothetical protein JCGZ_06597 [Jatropha curcas]